MKRVLLSLVLLLISIPYLPVLRATQEIAYHGKPVTIIPLGPKRSGPRTSFSNSIFKNPFRVVVRDRDTWLDLWKRIYQVVPSNGPYPELPEIDFSREMLVVAAWANGRVAATPLSSKVPTREMTGSKSL